METKKLKPYVRENMDVLFIGLNPSDISEGNGHYFSVKQSFWNQLYQSGLIIKHVDKMEADEIVFGTTKINRNQWNYGIIDLVHEFSDRDSRNVKPSKNDFDILLQNITRYKPKAVCVIHSKTMKCIMKYRKGLNNDHGQKGRIFDGVDSELFYVPFPHGNKYSDVYKVNLYHEIVNFIEGRQ